ncbi:MAG: CBS domain-containing protein [Pseudobacteriovorax sp.]|nr:CBS domain-containing protein [Pseudobacteriovorax sp.]
MEAPIKNYMTEQPHAIGPGETLAKARDMMIKFGIRHLPVRAHRKVIGIISNRDFELINLYPDMDLKHSKVEELMLQDVYSVGVETPLHQVVMEMAERKIGAALIVDNREELLGIFTAIDGLRLLSKVYSAD